MIKFTEGGLIDIWPEKDPEIQALSYALQQQFKKLKAYADKTQCYSDVDDLDEDILDYFADGADRRISEKVYIPIFPGSIETVQRSVKNSQGTYDLKQVDIP